MSGPPPGRAPPAEAAAPPPAEVPAAASAPAAPAAPAALAPAAPTAPPALRLCGARTRAGGACRAPAVRGRARCRMHSGAKGSGAPPGNRNALKHGRRTREAIARRRLLAALQAEIRATLRRFEP